MPFESLGLWVKKGSQRRPKTSLGIPGKRKGWQSTWPGELVQEPWQGRGLPRRRSHRRSRTADWHRDLACRRGSYQSHTVLGTELALGVAWPSLRPAEKALGTPCRP